MYKAIHYFRDLHDNDHEYKPGDVFPREGIQVDEKRLAELSGDSNKQGKPLIKKVDEKPEEKADESVGTVPDKEGASQGEPARRTKAKTSAEQG